jgi:ligand-binding sensor domain-containing protein
MFGLTSASTWTPSALECVIVLPRPGASYEPIVRHKNVRKMQKAKLIISIIIISYSCQKNSVENDNPINKELIITDLKKYTVENSNLVDNHINSITIDNAKTWFGTPSGIVLFENNNFKSYNYPTSRTNVIDILIENSDLIWYRHSFGNLYKFTPSQWTALEYTIYTTMTGNPACPEGINDWEIDNNGIKWAACNVGGGKLATFSSAPDDFNYIEYPTREGSLFSIEIINNAIWIGASFGLIKYEGKEWKFYDPSNSELPEYYVYAIKSDNNDNLIILTREWVTKFDGQVGWEKTNIGVHGSPNTFPSPFTIDKLSTIFIGNYNEGLEIYIDSKWIFLTEYKNETIGKVNCIEFDQNGSIWLGTDNGIIIFNYEYK